jgi:Bifunctional DNA primase/polymerase, N-terminal
VHDATADPDRVRQWWRRWSHANIGLRIRRIERVQLHADLTTLIRLACALATTPSAAPGRIAANRPTVFRDFAAGTPRALGAVCDPAGGAEAGSVTTAPSIMLLPWLKGA